MGVAAPRVHKGQSRLVSKLPRALGRGPYLIVRSGLLILAVEGIWGAWENGRFEESEELLVILNQGRRFYQNAFWKCGIGFPAGVCTMAPGLIVISKLLNFNSNLVICTR